MGYKISQRAVAAQWNFRLWKFRTALKKKGKHENSAINLLLSFKYGRDVNSEL